MRGYMVKKRVASDPSQLLNETTSTVYHKLGKLEEPTPLDIS
jgi:hypothetical protein